VLSRCAYVSDVRATGRDAEAAALYMALRRARIMGRPTVATWGKPDSSAWVRLQLAKLSRVGSDADGTAGAQRLDISIYRAFAGAGAFQPQLKALFVSEAVETLDSWVSQFFASPWFESIYAGTMTREQYVYTLSNMHQFVRWTTRLIGRAVSLSSDRELRNHWLKHLDGEINHELIIEKDLEELGVDVNYVTDAMVPNLENQQFMVIQESLIGFHQDPVLFMAAPFVAEGFSARLDRNFMDALERVVRSWGVANPRRATLFFSSHIEYDGGGEGHWEATRRILERSLTDETLLQRFLNAQRLAMAAFTRSYTSYVEDLAIFGAQPQ
jgi:hypothetical protein